MRLKDKVVIVTGSTAGIGEAMVKRFVAEGARVLVHGRDAARGKRCVESLGAQAVLHVDDLADPGAPARITEAALRAFGRIDAVVNNAARTARATLDETTPEFFEQKFSVNVRAPLLMVRAALEHLVESGGVVLNIGSVLGYCGEANLVAYSVSKGALMTLTRNLADSLGRRRVRVNQINVGWTLTETEYQLKVDDGLPGDWPEKLPAHAAPFGRLFKPEEVAAAALFWISDESWPATGSVTELEQYPIIGRMQAKEED